MIVMFQYFGSILMSLVSSHLGSTQAKDFWCHRVYGRRA